VQKKLTFSEKRKLAKKKKAKKQNLNGMSPSDAEINTLLEYYQNGQFSDAEKLAKSLTEKFPTHQFGWKVLGALFGQSGRNSEALNANQTAVVLSPQDASTHYNLGITLQELGKLHKAETSLRQAIVLKPNFAEAYSNLGSTLNELGKYAEAESSCRKSITLKPDFAIPHYNLGVTLQKLDRLHEAELSLRKAILLKPDFAEAHFYLGLTLQKMGRLDEAISADAQAITLNPDLTEATAHFGITIKNLRFKSSDPNLYPIFINLLTVGNVTRPTDVAYSILSLLKHDPIINELLTEKNAVRDLKEVTSAIEALDKLPLLHHLMRLCPLPDLQLEGLFVGMRRILLTNLDRFGASPELIYFFTTLSLQCFTNEYVYFETDEEVKLVYGLEDKIRQSLEKLEQPQLKELLCLASYRPLHHYDFYEKLEVLDQISEVKARLIEEPLAEKVIAQDIPILGKISDVVSLKVREQYEENPYPRWVKLAIPTKMISIANVCDDIELKLHSENTKDVLAPAILIAGCGTGQHSIGTASLYSNCQVLAVDLSLSSLAYAKRKTIELGLNNLEHLQADILKLDQLEREFDIIESVGVLHHMDDPMAGWKVLTNLLKPKGLMKIGLYSELARGHLVKTRQEISLQRVGTSEDEMRKFRWSLIESNNEEMKRLKTDGDFFSLSTLRDLIFHVQEHRFNLTQIQDCLDGLRLKFCGFEDKITLSQFREFYGEGSDIHDLALWHQFEVSNPDAFAGMYQFWCQKL
jgi:tetratricopeptide (TPR) repeat protein